MNTDRQIELLVSEFHQSVLDATHSMYAKMESRGTIEVLEWMLDVLSFRNSHVFETIGYLLEGQRIVGAELLLRTIFEGTVILEWCLVDPKERAQRFQKNAMAGTLGLIDEGFLKRSDELRQRLHDVVTHWEKESIKPLPNFRQMLESLHTYTQDDRCINIKLRQEYV